MVKRIDFHIHTVSTDKDYDFTYSSQWMQEYVSVAELDAIAVTNHDLFDEENFKQVKQDLPDITVFPGMELSLEEGHVNIIFPEEDLENLVEFSEWLNDQQMGSNGKISVESFCANMKNWENGIYIFELGKSNALSVPSKLKDVCAVGGVANQLRFQTVYNMQDGMTPVLFSDAHADYNDSDEKRQNITILKEKNTFIQIDNCTFREIKNCIIDMSKISINPTMLNDVIHIEDHRVSTGLNLIVGKRGTGKTNFLETIKKHYEEEDIYEIAQFETSNAQDYIEEQRRSQGINALDSWKKQYETQFSAIQDYLKRGEEDFNKDVDEYLDSVKKFARDTTASNSTSKYQLIKEINYENNSTSTLEKYLKRLKELITSQDLWDMLNNVGEKRKVFIEVYNELREVYEQKVQTNIIQRNVNDILDSVKEIVRSKTGITPVRKCEFSQIIKKYQIEKEIDNFMKEIIMESELRKEYIYGYQIIVKLAPFKNATQFQKDFMTNEAVYDDLIVPYKNKEFIRFLKNLKNKKLYNTSNLAEYFVHLVVDLLDSDGTPASGGQAVGFALMMRLEEAKSKSIILIDEPEASLDNDYIYKELRRAIQELTRNSTVFVVTHNSTLGTLLKPDYLIVTTKDSDSNYHVLTGEFTSNNISNNFGSPINSYEKFVEAMEASIETYHEKGGIYERLKN